MFGVLIAAVLIKRSVLWCTRDFDYLILVSTCVLSAGFLGARVAYVIISFPLSSFFSAFWQMLVVKGGFVFYGGLLGGSIGFWVGLRISKTKCSDYLDIYAVFIPFVHAFGRFGCYLAGCCYGKKYAGFGAIPWDKVANGRSSDVSYFPIQLVECLGLFVLSLCMYCFVKKNASVMRCRVVSMFLYVESYSVLRFVLEFFRGDDVRGAVLCFSTSQFISLSLWVLGILLLCIVNLRKSKTFCERMGFFLR